MKINIEKLKDGSNHWVENLNPRDLNLDAESFKEPVKVEIDVEKRAGKVPISLTSSTDGSFICDRCGEYFRTKVEGNCAVMFIQRETPLPEETPGDDLRSFHPGQTEIDITIDIRDTLILALPYRQLCSDNCLGLCPNCGANLNIEACTCKKQET